MDKSFISILLMFTLGIIFGIIFFFLISNSEKDIIQTGIKEYIGLINTNNIEYNKLINSFLNNFILLNIIFISSFSIVLFPLIHFINFYKGFILGFSFITIINIYKLKGILYFIIFIFPHEYILIPFIIILSTLMLKNTYKLNFNKVLSSADTYM